MTEKFTTQEIIKKMNSEATPLVAAYLFKYVQENKEIQPNSVKELLKKIEEGSIESDIFSDAYEIKGQKFLFAKMHPSEGSVFCLAQDKNNPKKWKSRGFHFSNSDHQFKLTAGGRKGGETMKGEESNPLHHYVQSGKISKDIYKIFGNIIRTKDGEHIVDLEENLPRLGGKFEDEFELKENFLELKNPEWNKFQMECQKFYNGAYKNLVQNPLKQPKNKSLQNKEENYYRFDEFLDNNPSIIDFNIEALRAKKKEIIKNMENSEFKNPSQRILNQILSVYSELVGIYIREQFQKPMPNSMLPDFSKSKMIDSYKKWDTSSQDKKDHITIEEYGVKSPEGDDIIFAMAYNEAGQVYIDNIYDPSVGINDYGIQAKIVNMGHLVYKPEDYKDQTLGISKEDRKTVNKLYDDITPLFENIPIIANYTAELKRRGVLN